MQFERHTEAMDAMRRSRLAFYYECGVGTSPWRVVDRIMTSICVMRRELDVVVLPAGLTVVDEMWAAAKSVYGYTDTQVVWYVAENVPSEPLPDESGWPHGTSRNVAAALGALAAHGTDFLLVPYMLTPELQAAAAHVRLPVYGDRYDHVALKDWAHPFPPTGAASTGHAVYHTPPRVTPKGDVPVPMGYTCRNKAELQEAYTILSGRLGLKVVFKPNWTAGGDGIILDVSQAQIDAYEFPSHRCSAALQDTIVLEELLRLDRKPDGAILSPVVHCLGTQLCGPVTEQLLRDSVAFDGSVCPGTGIPPHLLQTSIALTLRLAAVFGYTGFWGVDYLVQDGEMFLSDINTGRPNGGHTTKMFQHTWAPGSFHRMWKQRVPESLRVDEYVSRLADTGLLFHPDRRRGIALLTYTPGRMTRTIAVGRNAEDLTDLVAEFQRHVTALVAPADTASKAAKVKADVVAAEAAAAAAAAAAAVTSVTAMLVGDSSLLAEDPPTAGPCLTEHVHTDA